MFFVVFSNLSAMLETTHALSNRRNRIAADHVAARIGGVLFFRDEVNDDEISQPRQRVSGR